MQDLNDLYYYVQAVDHGGFAQAGRALGMPKSKLSRRITTLAERLGIEQATDQLLDLGAGRGPPRPQVAHPGPCHGRRRGLHR